MSDTTEDSNAPGRTRTRNLRIRSPHLVFVNNHQLNLVVVYYHLSIKKYIDTAVLHYFTESEARNSMEYHNLRNKAAIVPNGIDLAQFNELPQKDSIVSRCPFLKNKTIILYLGRIHPIKGLDTLLESFASILRENPEVYLLLVGGDESGYEIKVRQWVKEKQMDDHVIFAGLLHGHQKKEVLLGSDIFVLPSYSEAFSVSILEAMACRLSVIITNKCNFPDVAQRGASIVIEPNVEQLTSSLLGLISSPEKRLTTGNKGRKLVEEKFTWDKVAGQMIEVYEETLSC